MGIALGTKMLVLVLLQRGKKGGARSRRFVALRCCGLAMYSAQPQMSHLA